MTEPKDAETFKEKRDRLVVRSLEDAAKDAALAIGPIELTKEDIRNNWTEESLRAYLVDQQASQALRINPTGVMRRKPMPRTRSKPLRWLHKRG